MTTTDYRFSKFSKTELNTNSETIDTLAKEAAEVLNFVKYKNNLELHATRHDINVYFKSGSDCKKTKRITTLILNLLQNGWLKHQADVDSANVYYWFKDFSSQFEPKELFSRPIEYQDLYLFYENSLAESKTTVAKVSIEAKQEVAKVSIAAKPKPEVAKVSTPPSSPTSVTLLPKTSKVRIGTKLIDAGLVQLLIRSQLGEIQYQPMQKVKYGVLKIVEFLEKSRTDNIIEVANAIGISKRPCEICLSKIEKEIDNVDGIITLNEFGFSFISNYETIRTKSDWQAVVATTVLSQSKETNYCVASIVNTLKTYPLEIQKQVSFLLSNP